MNENSVKKSKSDLLKGFSPAVWLSAAASFLLFLYAPLEIYAGNYQDFSFDIYDILKYMPFVALGVFAVSTAVLLLVKRISSRLFSICLAVYLAAFLATYLQGTFFISNIPLLDGTAVDWDAYADQRIYTVLIWLVLLAAAFVLLKTAGKEKLGSAVKYIGVLGLLYLVLSLSLTLFTNQKVLKEKNETCMTGDSVMSMSADGKNFIILLLDSVDGKSFDGIVDADPEYQKVFEDFTSYTNTMSGYPYTTRSVPFILFGKWYDNSTYYPYYIKDAVAESLFMKRLDEEAFDKNVYFEYIQRANLPHEVFSNFKNVEKFSEPDKFCKMLIMLAGLKYLPYDFKPWCMLTSEDIYFDTLKTNEGEEIDYYSFDNSSVYNRFLNTDVSFSGKNSFKFLYATGAHGPYIHNENMERIEEGDYFTSIKASIKIADTYLKKLKQAGVYDNSVIVILADHGTNLENESLDTCKQNPFLLIKGLGEKHDYRKNDAPVSHEDLQEAFLELLDGASGDACFPWKEGDVRTRRYMLSEVVIESDITEQISEGHASDSEALVSSGNTFKFDWACVDAREAEERAKG